VRLSAQQWPILATVGAVLLFGCQRKHPGPTPQPRPAEPQQQAAQAEPPAPPIVHNTAGTGSKYRFSIDWVNTQGRAQSWPVVLKDLMGKKNLRGLEVGSFEGRSAIWFLDNVLTDESSTLTCIDLFAPEYDGIFDANIKASGRARRVTKIKGYSDRALRTLKPNTYDFIYLDGCHKAHCTLEDAVMSWDLLKVGGVLMFDDWLWNMDLPITERPKIAIDVFAEIYAPFIKVVPLLNSHSFFLVKTGDTRDSSTELWYKNFYNKK